MSPCCKRGRGHWAALLTWSHLVETVSSYRFFCWAGALNCVESWECCDLTPDRNEEQKSRVEQSHFGAQKLLCSLLTLLLEPPAFGGSVRNV